MKFLLTFLLFICSTIFAYSQRISLSNLIRVQNSSIVDAEDILLSLGFKHVAEYGKTEEFDVYNFQKNTSTSDDYINVSKFLYKGKNISTSVFTLYKSDYTELKKALAPQGFKYIETRKTPKDKELGEKVSHIYRKNGFEVHLSITQYIEEHRNNRSVSMYKLEIINIENENFYFDNTL